MTHKHMKHFLVTLGLKRDICTQEVLKQVTNHLGNDHLPLKLK